MIQSESEYSDQVFKNLDMPGVKVSSTTFLDCTFERCIWVEAIFQSCRFVDCHFRNCDCSLFQVPGSTFSSVRFENTKLLGMNWSLADWPEIGIGDPPTINKCSLNHSTFLGVHLGAVKLRRSEAINVDFREAVLSGSDFAFTDLKDSLFQSTDLIGADFRYARNYHIDPSKNKITKAKFSLPEAMALLYSMDIDIFES